MMNSYQNLAERLCLKKHRWIVTGAAGFIGSNLSLRLLELNQEVVGIDNFSTGLKENIFEIEKNKNSKNWSFIESDVGDTQKISQHIKEDDLVLHQAALGSVPRSIQNPISSHLANVDSFVKFLWLCTEQKVAKFVFASSSSVYGTDNNLPKKEHLIGSPMSPYAATKRIDEIYAETFFRTYGSPTIGLRYFNVFGPRQSPNGPYAAVIPLWIDAVANNKTIYINGDGSYSRDFCYIENTIQANLLAAFSKKSCHGQVYNIALEQKTSLLELIEMIQSKFKQNDPFHNMSPVVHRDYRAGDVPHSLADTSLAKIDLGYSPEIEVKEGLHRTIDFFRKLKGAGLE